jgi:hypothetical protein
MHPGVRWSPSSSAPDMSQNDVGSHPTSLSHRGQTLPGAVWRLPVTEPDILGPAAPGRFRRGAG